MVQSKKSVARIAGYKTALDRFQRMGLVRIFSDNLADATGVSASQVRKDFSLFGISGNKRGGYQIDELLACLHKILNKDEVQNVVMVGMGNIGSALVKYGGFEKEGIRIIAGFDADPKKCSGDGPTPVFALEQLVDFVRSRRIRIGIIAVPDTAAQQVANLMVAAGIKGLLNFAPIRLRVSDDVVIHSVNLVVELERVIYFSSLAPQETVRE